MREGVAQLKMQLADFYTDNNFANKDGWMQHATAASLPSGSVITDETFSAWIAKDKHPDIETLLYGSWGWSTDLENVTAHVLFHPESKCEFMDHNNVTVTGADNMVPWCEWRVDYETLQLVITLPEEDEGLSGGFAWPDLTDAWMNRDIGADGFPSDEALTWLVQDNNAGKWAFSPVGDLTQLNATHFV